LLQRDKSQYLVSNHSITEDIIQWTRPYGGNEDDTAMSVIQTTNGDYLFAGITGSWPNDDAWLVKIDKYGNIKWTQIYNYYSSIYSIITTDDGGFALSGIQGGYLGSPSNAWLMKTDKLGLVEWNQTYDWRDYDQGWSVIQTKDDNFALGGSSSNVNHNWDGWLMKINFHGNMMWNRTYGGSSSDHVQAVIQTYDDGFALTGDTWSYGVGLNDGWLVKTNTNGVVMWNRTYGGLGTDRFYEVIQTIDLGFVLVGATSSFGTGGFDAWLVKTDSVGNIIWMRTYGAESHDAAYSGISTVDGGFVLAGSTSSYVERPTDMNFWLLKLDKNGNIEWNQTYGGSKKEELFSVIQTSDGGYILAGRTLTFGAGKWDAWLVKTDFYGNAPNIYTPQLDWFVIGLIGSLALAATVVVILYVKGYLRLRKWP